MPPAPAYDGCGKSPPRRIVRNLGHGRQGGVAQMPEVQLRVVDAVEVTIVIDLYLDLLMAGQEGVRRFPLAYDWVERDKLLAEHGFSALIRVTGDGQTQSILY